MTRFFQGLDLPVVLSYPVDDALCFSWLLAMVWLALTKKIVRWYNERQGQ